MNHCITSKALFILYVFCIVLSNTWVYASGNGNFENYQYTTIATIFVINFISIPWIVVDILKDKITDNVSNH